MSSTTSPTAPANADERSSAATSSGDESNLAEPLQRNRERGPALGGKFKAWPLAAGVAGIGSALLILGTLDTLGLRNSTAHAKPGIGGKDPLGSSGICPVSTAVIGDQGCSGSITVIGVN